jgi:2-oxoisovalerate dehydrogenase E1 component
MAKTKEQFSLKKTKPDELKKWYYLLKLGRALDIRAANYLKQALGWSYHAPYAGHDAIQMALGLHFKPKHDHMFPYYRDMMSALSGGISIVEILLNGMSKASDVASGGRHMSNHFAKPELNVHNVSSCTGNHTLHAVGLARAIKTYGEKDKVVYSSQGESSLSEGYCYEAIVGADRERLPVIFVIQDNGFGISVPKCDQTANKYASDNFSGLKYLKILHCKGEDVIGCMNTMAEAKRITLEEEVPVMVHADVVRMGSHSNSDKHELYRSEKEIKDTEKRDPLTQFEKLLLDNKVITKKDIEKIDEEVKKEIIAAHKEAMKAPQPDPESIFDFVLPPEYDLEQNIDKLLIEGGQKNSGEEIAFITSINETLKSEFRHNPDTYIWGQDVAHKEKGGIFNVTKGMQQEFGKHRVFNGPIAEDFILGTANGFVRYNDKVRVVVEGAEFADYFWPAMEQMVETSHDYWRSNGQFSPNLTIRIASGGYIGGGLYHSQNIEGALTTLPGIRVVVPSFADDAAGLLRNAMRSQGVTVYLEPKALYNSKQARTSVDENYIVPFGKAKVRKEGTDISLITYGNTVHFCLEVAEKLAEEGKSVEVLDLRSLSPLDYDAINKTVQKTNRALVVHEDKVFSGFGGEIASYISDELFEYLDAPVKRIGSTFTPVGFNRIFERATLPNSDKILNKTKELLNY